MKKKRYVIVGASARCRGMFLTNLVQKFADEVEVTGVYDVNRMRSEYFKNIAGDQMTIYEDFDEMLDKEKPDAVLVTTTDKYHHEYIIRALNKGYDVISEKPITNNYENCVAIAKAVSETGKSVATTFNCRFMPIFAKMKEIIMSGKIGNVLNINYEYFLNRSHGGDYFKRWHRMMENSGGMLVHKSTHHFDVINWFLEDEPVKVSALGNRLYYGDPSKSFGERCSTCPKGAQCPSFLSQSGRVDKEFYFDAEHLDGYIRDRCCYLPDTDIYDTMSVSVQYSKGTMLTYGLNLFSIRGEGYTMTVTGDKGVLRVENISPEDVPTDKHRLDLYLEGGEHQVVIFDKGKGTHAGGDERLLAKLFGNDKTDELHQCADYMAGLVSAMIGISGNESIATGKTIDVKERIDYLKSL